MNSNIEGAICARFGLSRVTQSDLSDPEIAAYHSFLLEREMMREQFRDFNNGR